MLYNSLKILHILSASFVLTSMIYSFHLWRSISTRDIAKIAEKIHAQTFFVIIPFALVQLGSGFTLISLQRRSFSSLWIGGSVISFIVAIISWLAFIYFLVLSQQVTSSCHQNRHIKLKHDRRTQAMMLLLSAFSLLCMLFFMANKTALAQ